MADSEAKLKVNSFGFEGNNLTVTLSAQNFVDRETLSQLEIDNTYFVKFVAYKTKRSIEQNALMWELLTKIDHKINGERSNDAWKYYCIALRKAGAKTEILKAPVKASEDLKKVFRAIEILKYEGDYAYYRCYYGSSHMNTKEMSILIDCVLDMAESCGIETISWAEILKGE